MKIIRGFLFFFFFFRGRENKEGEKRAGPSLIPRRWINSGA